MSHSHSAVLSIALTGYWHAGSGRGAGHHLDAVCERDSAGLPVLPGKQVKGLLRQAVARAEAWSWFSSLTLPDGPMPNFETLLFGSESQGEDRYQSQPGMLRVASAALPETEHLWLAQPEQTGLRQMLFSELFSTAIDELSGSAKNGSLRGIEVAIPCSLRAALTLHANALESDLRQQQNALLATGDGWRILEQAASLIDAVGAGRTRGLGEATITLMTETTGAAA